MNKIPLYLVTGFLGSGKTTLIKNILQEYGDEKIIAIVQNEFAPANVDSIDLRNNSKPFELLEVNRGSVFCVCLFNDFITSLNRFICQYEPDMLILETSGLADPITIAELMESKKIRDKIILAKVFTVIDASNFTKLIHNTRVIHQIRIADEILINKTDIFEDDLEMVRSKVLALNPYAKIVSTRYCNISMNGLSSKMEPSVFGNHELIKIEGTGKPEISAKVLKTRRVFSIEKVIDYFASSRIELLRIKGYLNLVCNKTLAIQYVFGRLEVTEITDYSGPKLLIAMGNSDEINSTFQKMLAIAESR